MTTHDANQGQAHPDWSPEPHCGCPFDDHCAVCAPKVPANVILGSE